MGLYIKGRDLPKNCDECVAGYGGCCYLAPPESDGICPEDPEMGRAEFCPLVYVPPHGRLIDADALYEDCALDHSYEAEATTTRINEYMQIKIDAAPTVIPAEKEE